MATLTRPIEPVENRLLACKWMRSLLGLSIIIRSVRRVVLHYKERSVCVLAHIALTGAAASQTEDCLCQLEELDVMFAGVVGAAWLTPT